MKNRGANQTTEVAEEYSVYSKRGYKKARTERAIE
jgi:hypothetical protein